MWWVPMEFWSTNILHDKGGYHALSPKPTDTVGEVRVGEDGAELVTEAEERVALAEGGLGDARRPFRHGLDRAGLEHGGPPADWTRRSIPAHLGSADFANGIRSFRSAPRDRSRSRMDEVS